MTIEWTEEGRQRLAARLAALPLEPGVREEQRLASYTFRIEEALRACGGGSVTGPVLDTTLDAVLAGRSLRRRWRQDKGSTAVSLWLQLVCVFAPAFVLAFELATRMCTAEFFDPVPTMTHALAIAGVPVAAFLGLRAHRESASPALLRRAAFAIGVALPIAGAYFVVFLPLVPMSVIGVAFAGLGLLSLTPVVCFPSLAMLQVKVVRRARARGAFAGGAAWSGVVTGLLVLALLEGPTELTRRWASQALEGTPSERAAALQRLRTFGSERALIDLASARSSGAGDLFWFTAPWSNALALESARKLWFRVSGEPFHARPVRSLLDEVPFDELQGGSVVGPIERGMELVSSRLDAAIEAEAGVAYVEWTLEVENLHEWGQSEARALVELPDEAVVSRATLWIGDEEREAAYTGSSAARAAYEAVAISQRLDPLLVTSAGDDHVLVQVFPVPRGEIRRFKLGITIPLELTPSEARLVWPRLAARNFALAPGLTHELWAQAPQRLAGEALTVSAQADGWEARGESALEDPAGTRAPEPLRIERQGTAAVACAYDGERELVCRFSSAARARTDPVVVVNGSAALRPHVAELERALATLTTPYFLSTDEGYVERAPAATRASLTADDFVGGRDDTSALEAAWDRARELGTDVLWLAGPQPLLLESSQGLEQRFARAPDGPRLWRCAVVRGENALLAALARVPELESLPADGVERALARLRGGDGLERAFSLEPAGGGLRAGPLHLRALWANAEIERLLRTAAREPERAVALASAEHLVTRVSGAVVLETEQQFAEHGLEPVDARALPSVPEPEEWLLLCVAAGALAWVIVAQRGRAA
jgi:hypothetical protein